MLMKSMTVISAVTVLVGLVGSPAVAGPKTTVRLNVSGCEGCTFVAHDGRTWEKSWEKVATSTPVLDGRATIVVARRLTPVMSFEVAHPDGLGSENATAFVATSWKRAKSNYDGSYYWDGGICLGRRLGKTATLNVVVTEYVDRIGPGTPKERFIDARLAKLPAKAYAGVNGSPGCPEFRKRVR